MKKIIKKKKKRNRIEAIKRNLKESDDLAKQRYQSLIILQSFYHKLVSLSIFKYKIQRERYLKNNGFWEKGRIFAFCKDSEIQPPLPSQSTTTVLFSSKSPASYAPPPSSPHTPHHHHKCSTDIATTSPKKIQNQHHQQQQNE